MTGSSTYSNKQHPMSEATIGDAPLEWQSTSFPPTWDGLVQMRLLLSAPNQQVLFTPYPAAVIKISGGTWTLVDGDTSPACSSGQAVSSEKVLIPAKLQPTAPPPGATTPSAAPSGSATLGSVSSDPSGSNTSNVEPGGGQSGANAAAPARTNSSPSIVPIALALVAITAVVAGGVGFWAARTRGAEPSGRH